MNENTIRKQKTFVFLPSQFNSDNVIDGDNSDDVAGRIELDKQSPMANGQFSKDTNVIPNEFDWRQRGVSFLLLKSCYFSFS